MLPPEELTRFRELRNRFLRRESLSTEEQGELDRLMGRMEEEEEARLQPAFDTLDEKLRLLEACEQQLDELLQRERLLRDRARALLNELLQEQTDIDGELARVLSRSDIDFTFSLTKV